MRGCGLDIRGCDHGVAFSGPVVGAMTGFAVLGRWFQHHRKVGRN
jgi:hypothetical protein